MKWFTIATFQIVESGIYYPMGRIQAPGNMTYPGTITKLIIMDFHIISEIQMEMAIIYFYVLYHQVIV